MKLYSLILGIFLLCSTIGHSQFEWGVLLGGSSVDIKPNSFLIKNDNQLDSFTLSFQEANYGFHIGGFIRYSIGKFFIQPELVFNTNKTTFKLREFGMFQTSDSLRDERYQKLDIPFIMGGKFGIFRINAGPVAHIFLNNKSDLVNVSGYKEKFQSATYGYQIGLGFDFGLLTFDLRHEGNFSKYGEHINFFNQNLAFDKSESRLLGTIGFKF
ncbi:MAG: hypothetical protein HOP11_02520 [Saprospiraceae bacterium]|nr:hypothetical protein [Saprospiraceae bacterium]